MRNIDVGHETVVTNSDTESSHCDYLYLLQMATGTTFYNF